MTPEKATTYLFSDAGLSALRGFVDRSTLLAFDLDGTLAPLVPDPSRIRIPEPVRQGLARLCESTTVAVITGRACRDARKHLGFEPHFVVGNHGAEGLPGREFLEQRFVRQCIDWEAQLRELLPDLHERGIVVENKGMTLSLHYRQAPDREAAQRSILLAVQRLSSAPRRVAGVYVENLIPPDAPNKGDALLLLMESSGCGRSLFVGDDETDEDVFRLRSEGVFGVRVGYTGTGSASYYMKSQEEIQRLTAELVLALQGPASSRDAYL
ncbi:MAG: trehalose-phosphatase [Deltaproteobacteria bacterium]|nr:trehalose-phosphatase [Deltaproteobacteria bacterium]